MYSCSNFLHFAFILHMYNLTIVCPTHNELGYNQFWLLNTFLYVTDFKVKKDHWQRPLVHNEQFLWSFNSG